MLKPSSSAKSATFPLTSCASSGRGCRRGGRRAGSWGRGRARRRASASAMGGEIRENPAHPRLRARGREPDDAAGLVKFVPGEAEDLILAPAGVVGEVEDVLPRGGQARASGGWGCRRGGRPASYWDHGAPTPRPTAKRLLIGRSSAVSWLRRRTPARHARRGAVRGHVPAGRRHGCVRSCPAPSRPTPPPACAYAVVRRTRRRGGAGRGLAGCARPRGVACACCAREATSWSPASSSSCSLMML